MFSFSQKHSSTASHFLITHSTHSETLQHFKSLDIVTQSSPKQLCSFCRQHSNRISQLSRTLKQQFSHSCLILKHTVTHMITLDTNIHFLKPLVFLLSVTPLFFHQHIHLLSSNITQVILNSECRVTMDHLLDSQSIVNQV